MHVLKGFTSTINKAIHSLSPRILFLFNNLLNVISIDVSRKERRLIDKFESRMLIKRINDDDDDNNNNNDD